MLFDDAIRDRKPRPVPCPVAAAGEERLEQVLAALRRSCRSRCRERCSSALAAAFASDDRDGAAGVEAVEAVGDQVQHDLLDFLGVDRRR